MKFEVSFKVDITPRQRELLELRFTDALKLMGIEPEGMIVSLCEKPDFIPAVAPATFTQVPTHKYR